MADPDKYLEEVRQVLTLAHFYCPRCGCREELGTRCICGLLWTDERREMRHYARLLSDGEAENLRHALARRQTRQATEDCNLYTKREGPRLFCVSKSLRRMWRDPD